MTIICIRMAIDGHLDKRLMVTVVVVFQKLSAINAIIVGNLEAGCFVISVHQLIGQVWYSCIHNFSAFQICPSHYRLVCRARLKRDGTRAETKFGLSAKRTSPFKSAGGRQFSRLLAAELCASAVVMLDTPCSEVECKTTGYPLHSHVSPTLPLPCVTVCHQVSTELYYPLSRIWKPWWRDASYSLQKRQMRLVWYAIGQVKKG